MRKSRLGIQTLNKSNTSNKKCILCLKVKRKESFSPANYSKSDYRCRICLRKKALEWQTRNPEKHRAIVLRATKKYAFKSFGVDENWYNKKLLEQDGKCAICDRQDSGVIGKRFHIDHCHKTNKNRALLCNNCNCGLGNFKDNQEFLLNAISYLKKYSIE